MRRYGGVLVLKGAGTLLAAEDGAVADVGKVGMALGGMGDVLSGIIGSLLEQKLSLYDAACVGCVVHGATADHLAAEIRHARYVGHRFAAGIVSICYY